MSSRPEAGKVREGGGAPAPALCIGESLVDLNADEARLLTGEEDAARAPTRSSSCST